MIKAIWLPEFQPALSTTSWTRDEISGVLCFWPTVFHAGMSFQATEDVVVGLFAISKSVDVKVEALSES